MRSSSIEGRVLGDYRLGRRLGAGGIGAVYEATHVRTGRGYAVKVLLPEAADEPTAAARFRREAQALASVGHQGIVALHDFDVTNDGVAYLVMDQLEGEDLDARLQRGPLSVRGAVQVFDEVAAALGAAHAAGILHRDLKPSNVFLARRPGAAEHAVLLDFGLAKLTEGEHAKLTATGAAMGTPMYMSPEQAQGLKVDVRTDVYALAAVLFEMLTGHAPFEGPSITAILSKVLTQPPPRLRHFDPELPATLEAVIIRALAKDAAQRPSSVDALVEEVHGALGDTVPSAPRPPRRAAPPPTRTTPLVVEAPTRAPTKGWIGGGAALAAAVIVGGVVWWSSRGGDGEGAARVAPVPVGVRAPAEDVGNTRGTDARGTDAHGTDVRAPTEDVGDARDTDARNARDTDARDTDARGTDARDTDARDTDARDTDARDTDDTAAPAGSLVSAKRPPVSPRRDARPSTSLSLEGFDPRSLLAQLPRARATLTGYGQGLAEPRPPFCAIPMDTSPLRILPHGTEVVSRLERTRVAVCAQTPASDEARAAHRASLDAARDWLAQLEAAARREPAR
ncbi:MAG: serine/threonine protein kinase [Myxococcales bacterium]|nr:serine/threonine protein kinase [Myxococcales bacterium]